MTKLPEGKFEYVFPEGWLARKWDATSFHQEKFQSFGGSSKAAEFVAFDENNNTIWLIECKDFRPSGRRKSVDLCDEIAQKFRSTLAGLVCARNETDPDMRRFSRMALKQTLIRCVVHWEYPSRPHRLWPKEAMNPSAVRAKLRDRLSVADSKAELGTCAQLNAKMPWKINPL